VIRTLPLPLRDRLAATILEAVDDVQARRALARLADAPDAWLAANEREWRDLLAQRARRASEALAARGPSAKRGLDAALEAAATLYEAGLHFEVHELLEPHWMAASGETREALQGVIQAAVGWQHLANDNVAGARSLLMEGAARLNGRRLAGRDFDAFARATAEAVTRLPAASPPPFPAPASVSASTSDASDREESV
jgi:predicted metal-dependent hydrolase